MPRCCSKRKKAANRSPTNGRATPQIGVSQRYSRKKYGKTCNADANHRLVGQGGNARLAPTRPCVIIDQLGEISWPTPPHLTKTLVPSHPTRSKAPLFTIPKTKITDGSAMQSNKKADRKRSAQGKR